MRCSRIYSRNRFSFAWRALTAASAFSSLVWQDSCSSELPSFFTTAWVPVFPVDFCLQLLLRIFQGMLLNIHSHEESSTEVNLRPSVSSFCSLCWDVRFLSQASQHKRWRLGTQKTPLQHTLLAHFPWGRILCCNPADTTRTWHTPDQKRNRQNRECFESWGWSLSAPPVN